MTGSGASGGRGRVKDREATATRRWGSRFSSAATGIGREAPGSICRRKWWGPAVLEAVSVVCQHGKTVRDICSRGVESGKSKGRADARGREASEPDGHTSWRLKTKGR